MKSTLLSTDPLTWSLGDIPSVKSKFLVGELHLSRHLGVFGGSGSGKSKLLELLCRRMMDDYRGFCFIDPHGDTAEDLLAYASLRRETLRSDAVCKRIHYLEPTFETVFGFDPFVFKAPVGIAAEDHENAYHSWLHAKADKVAEVVQRKQGVGDFQGMARLQRILRDVLIAVGTAIDATGRHLPLSDILVLLDSHNARHRDVLRIVLPHLPQEVQADFASLAAARTEEQRKKETESTINRLRSLLSPIVKAIFTASTGSIDFRKIIASRGIVLVNLRKTDFFSADQRNAIGGLIIHEILSAAETTSREDRAPYYLFVDEARLFIGEDMMEALDQARKFKLSICLAGQHLNQFRTEEFDMTPSILNNCGTVVCFQQKHPDDLKLWKEYFGYANLSFEKHFQVVDRPDGFDFFAVTESSVTEGTSRTHGKSLNVTKGVNHSTNSSESQQQSTFQQQSTQRGISSSESSMSGEGRGSGLSIGQSPLIVDGQLQSMISTESDNSIRHTSSQSGTSQSVSYAEGEGSGETLGTAHTRGESSGTSESRGVGKSVTKGTNTSQTESERLMHLPRTREERHESPSLQNSVEDQFHRFAATQRVLPQRHAMVSLAGEQQSFVIQVGDVQPAYAENFHAKVTAMKKRIFSVHPYYSKPDLSPEEQDRRLDEFLAAAGVESVRKKSPPGKPPEKPPFGV